MKHTATRLAVRVLLSLATPASAQEVGDVITYMGTTVPGWLQGSAGVTLPRPDSARRLVPGEAAPRGAGIGISRHHQSGRAGRVAPGSGYPAIISQDALDAWRARR